MMREFLVLAIPFLLAPFCGGAVPAVSTESGVERGGEGAAGAGGQVGFDVGEFAHAGDGGGHAGMVEDEAESHVRHGHARRNEGLEGFRAGHALFEIFGDEISVAPVALRPFAVYGERASESA